jgi:hypothetical protein
LRVRYSSPPRTVRPSPPQSPTSPKTAETTKLNRRQREYQAFQRVVALAPRTAEENMKLSAASVYNSLTVDQRSQLKETEALDKLQNEVQEGLFNAHLQKQGIITNFIEDGVDEKVSEIFFRLPLSDVKFVLAGPRQSGKTALLHTMASVLNRKLLLSAEAGRYLLFPLNFEFASLNLSDPTRLLRLFVTTAFEALEYSSLRLIPVVDSLRRWFLISIFGSSVPPPSQNGLIDVTQIHALARRLNSALIANSDHSLEEFVQTVASFPREFAIAFGFVDAIYIFDSFEFSSIQLKPEPAVFPRSLKSANLGDAICVEIGHSSYIVALQNEQEFMEAFSCPDAALIDTQGLLTVEGKGMIEVVDPPLRITIEDCFGCPGFIGRFTRLLDEVKRSDENTAIPGKFSAVKTVTDISRRKSIKLGIVRLASLLNGAKNERFTLDLLNELVAAEDVFTRVISFDEELARRQSTSLAEQARGGQSAGIDK